MDPNTARGRMTSRRRQAAARQPDETPSMATVTAVPSAGQQQWAVPVAYSRDGVALAFVTDGGAVVVKSPETRRNIATLQGNGATVQALVFSPDGKLLASGGDMRRLIVWRLGSRRPVALLEGHARAIISLAFSPDGSLVASGSEDKTVRLWDLKAKQLLATLEGHSRRIGALAFSPDGSRLASGGDDTSIRLWSVETRKTVALLEFHTRGISAVTFSPDGRTLASGSEDKSVRLWDLDTLRASAALQGHAGSVTSVAFSPDGGTLASASTDDTVRVWDVESHQALATLDDDTTGVRCLVFSEDSRQLVGVGGDATLRRWNLMPRQTAKLLEGHGEYVRSIVYAPDGKALASAGDGRAVIVWDVGTGQSIATLQGHGRLVFAVAWSKDGRLLATASEDKTVRLWDVAKKEATAVLKGHTAPVRSVAFHPTDSRRLASGSHDKTVRLWDLRGGKATAEVIGEHTGKVRAVAYHPSAKLLASGGDDRVVRLWDPETRTATHVLEGHTHHVRALAFSPDGRTLASGSHDKTVRLWDTGTLLALATLEGHADYVRSLSFGPRSLRLASGSQDKTIRLWDVAAHRAVAVLEGHDGIVGSVGFSPDGQTLASGSEDKTVRLWPLGGFVAGGCSSLPAFPLCALTATGTIDRSHPDPTQRLATLAGHMKRLPLTLRRHLPPPNGHLRPLDWAAAEAERADYLRCFLSVPLPSLHEHLIAPTLASAIDSNDSGVVHAVLTKIVEAARARDAFVDNPADRRPWILAIGTLGQDFTREVIRLVQERPDLAVAFLRRLGLVRVRTDYGYDQSKTVMPDSGIITAGADSPEAHQAELWARQLKAGALAFSTATVTRTDARVVPIPFAASFVPVQAKLAEDPSGVGAHLYQLVCKVSAAFGRGPGERVEAQTSLLEALVDAEDPNLFDNLVAKAVVQHKWMTFARRKFVQRAVVHILELLCLTSLSLSVDWAAAGTDGQAPSHGFAEETGALLAAALVATSLYNAGVEVREIRAFGHRYRLDLWNLLDWLHVVLCAALAAHFFWDHHWARPALAIALYLRWFRTLFYLQPFSSTGPLVSMLLTIMWDMRPFLLVLTVAILGATFCFRLVRADVALASSAYVVFRDTLDTFSLLVLGAGDAAASAKEPWFDPLDDILLALSLLFVNVVLLNLLIAMMSDSYEQIRDRAENEFQYLRAHIILQVEYFLPASKRRDRALFPAWLHVLVPSGEGVTREARPEHWQGALEDVRRELAQQAERSERVAKAEAAAVRAELNDKLDRILQALAMASTEE